MFFRLLLLAFLDIFITVMICFKNEVVDTNKDFYKVSRIVAMFFTALTMLFIGMLFVLTAIESDPKRDTKQATNVYLNTLYLGMSPKRRTAANIYLISFVLRRAVYALIVTLMDEYPTFQLFAMIMISALTTMVITR